MPNVVALSGLRLLDLVVPDVVLVEVVEYLPLARIFRVNLTPKHLVEISNNLQTFCLCLLEWVVGYIVFV